jgi:hypothetical protein
VGGRERREARSVGEGGQVGGVGRVSREQAVVEMGAEAGVVDIHVGGVEVVKPGCRVGDGEQSTVRRVEGGGAGNGADGEWGVVRWVLGDGAAVVDGWGDGREVRGAGSGEFGVS